jgi:hypothetical protein
MLPPDRAQSFADMAIEQLLSVLLRQLKRPLASHGVHLTDAEAERLAHNRAAGKLLDLPPLIPALVALVTESELVLSGIGFAFIESLDTPMEHVPGWETTAEFLDIANEKSNAELRITLGAALALAFGEEKYAPYLRHLAEGEYGDETIIAQRALAFAEKRST